MARVRYFKIRRAAIIGNSGCIKYFISVLIVFLLALNNSSSNSINESTFDELLAGGVIGGDPKVIKCTKNP